MVTGQFDETALRADLEQAQEALGRLDYATAHDSLVDLRSRCDPSAGPGVVAIRVRVLISLATTALEVGGDLPDSLALLDEAIGLAEDHDQPEHLGVVIGARAYCHLRTGRLDQAIELFAELEPHLDVLSARDRATALNNRGALHLDQGRVGDAIRDLERVQADAAETGDLQLQAKALHNLGYAAFLRGDLPGALERFAEIERLDGDAEELQRLHGDTVLLADRARVLHEAGLVDEADELLVEALRAAAGSGRDQDVGEAHLARARGALMVGDLERVVEDTQLAREAFARRRNRLWLRRTDFMRLGARLERLQALEDARADPPEVVDGAQELLAAITAFLAAGGDQDPWTASTRAMLAETAVLAGDLERADKALAGMDPPDPGEALSVRLRWYRARAGLAGARGEPTVGDVVRAGLDELARAQARLGSVDLRTAMAVHGRELAGLGVAEALRRGEPTQIHAAVEQAHASSTRLAPVRMRASDEERELLARLRRVDEASWHADEPRDAPRRAVLRREAARLQRALREHEWERVGGRGPEPIASLDEVRASLATHDAVAATLTNLHGDLVAVRVDVEGVTVVPLGPQDRLAAVVGRIRSDLQAGVLPGIPGAVLDVMRASLDEGLAELDERLVAPLEAAGRPLVIVPHAEFGLVPWSLVPGRRGLATITAPCLTEWRRVSKQGVPGPGVEPSVSALAGPGLQRAEAEARDVAGRWPSGRHVLGAEVTGRAVLGALDRDHVVHLATHGQHQATSPLFSSLRLADGPLFAHEVASEPTARLVVLSSCEVGSHTVRPGDEPLGMTAALLQAGVPTVLASLARVRDDVAHDVMVAVHRELVGGATPAGALGTAVAEAHDAGRLAPFACVGGGLSPLVGVGS